jgi:hypothetical protein
MTNDASKVANDECNGEIGTRALRNCALLLFVVWIVSSCGYSVRSLLPPHLKTVAIVTVENSTTQPGLDEELSIVLPKIFNSDRSLRVTAPEQADLVVSVVLTSFYRTAAAYDAEQAISAYEISISARVEALDQVRNEMFFSGTVSSRISYTPEGTAEENAISAAIEKLAREIARQIVTAW